MTPRDAARAEIVVRPAGRSDIEPMRAVEVDAGRRFADIGLHHVAEDAPPAAEVLAGHVDDGRAWVAFDEDDGSIVGFALVSVVDGDAHLDQVSVKLGSGGVGTGRALVDVAVAWAIDRGHTAMTLTTFRDVEFNGPWYRRLGFGHLHDVGPHLAAIRAAERAAGLDVVPRTAMRLELGPTDAPTP